MGSLVIKRARNLDGITSLERRPMCKILSVSQLAELKLLMPVLVESPNLRWRRVSDEIQWQRLASGVCNDAKSSEA